MKSKNELKANHNSGMIMTTNSKLANMKSKNELKANHNSTWYKYPVPKVGKYEVKERIESKSQPVVSSGTSHSRWQI